MENPAQLEKETAYEIQMLTCPLKRVTPREAIDKTLSLSRANPDVEKKIEAALILNPAPTQRELRAIRDEFGVVDYSQKRQRVESHVFADLSFGDRVEFIGYRLLDHPWSLVFFGFMFVALVLGCKESRRDPSEHEGVRF